jgi:hypothetical protein
MRYLGKDISLQFSKHAKDEKVNIHNTRELLTQQAIRSQKHSCQYKHPYQEI